MKVLELKPVNAVDHLVHPEEFADIDWDSSALEIFTDFRFHKPQVIFQGVSVDEADRRMRRAHVKLMLVVDDRDEFVGTVSAADLEEQNLMQHTSRDQARKDLRVVDVMQPRGRIQALEFSLIAGARIRDVVETLRQRGQQHCLVVDTDNHHIRGVISSSDIARRLHMPIEITRHSSFVELFNTIRH
ncbi:CBS domain-containing protein [Parahaliea aestuarii]|nr:CBS domain-containing protein [Parahaliea aestuarii]